jgi:hypothetical protein
MDAPWIHRSNHHPLDPFDLGFLVPVFLLPQCLHAPVMGDGPRCSSVQRCRNLLNGALNVDLTLAL